MSKALEEAADTAIKDAGVKKEDVTICKLGTDYENGREVYVVEFLEEGKTKYSMKLPQQTAVLSSTKRNCGKRRRL